MDSIFNQDGNDLIISRINSLTPNSQAKWGKMNVSQMLSHCQAPIDVAFGDLKLKSNFILQLFGKMYKNKILKASSFKKNSPTSPDFIRNKVYNFEKTKSKLIQKIKKFTEIGPSVIKNQKHPFFGEMTTAEWDRLQWMHLDHHLKQFGV